MFYVQCSGCHLAHAPRNDKKEALLWEAKASPTQTKKSFPWEYLKLL